MSVEQLVRYIIVSSVVSIKMYRGLLSTIVWGVKIGVTHNTTRFFFWSEVYIMRDAQLDQSNNKQPLLATTELEL
jgi:hypothetical protein